MATKKKITPVAKPSAASGARAGAALAVVADAATPGPADAVVAPRTPMLRIRELVTQVIEATGGKKKDVREIVEATLTVLGDALARGDDMNLPGLGRTRIARSTERDGAAHLTLKVRRGPHKPKVEKEPLAEEEDDG